MDSDLREVLFIGAGLVVLFAPWPVQVVFLALAVVVGRAMWRRRHAE